jgi:excisionase family DNA binding protein
MGIGKIQQLNSNDSGRLDKPKVTQGIVCPLPKRLYTLSEAAGYLGRTLWSMRELVWSGKIPIVRDGKRIFVDVRDLESYIAKHKMTYA